MRTSSSLLAIDVSAALFAGCASSGHRGTVLKTGVGTRPPDLTFLDEEGETRRLSRDLGDFTILAFTKCGGDLHGPVSKALETLVAENQETGKVQTVGFDIHWSEAGCTEHADCHLLRRGNYLYSICDGCGAVRSQYGADEGSQFLVIGPDRRVMDGGSLSEFDSLHAFRRYVASERVRDFPDEMP